jgi:hypothetical protein
MKKFLFVLLFSTSAMAIITDPMSNYFDNTGTLVKQDKVFIQVKAGNAFVKGDIAAFSTTADDGATVVDATALGQFVACVIAEDLASGAKGLCQVYGYATVNKGFGNNFVAGSPIYAGADALGGKAAAITSPSAGQLAIGVALDASSATESVEAFIRLL